MGAPVRITERYSGASAGRSQSQLAVVDVDGDLATVGDLAADQQPGQPVADGGLDQAAQRPGAVRRVVAGLGQPGARGVGDLDA